MARSKRRKNFQTTKNNHKTYQGKNVISNKINNINNKINHRTIRLNLSIFVKDLDEPFTSSSAFATENTIKSFNDFKIHFKNEWEDINEYIHGSIFYLLSKNDEHKLTTDEVVEKINELTIFHLLNHRDNLSKISSSYHYYFTAKLTFDGFDDKGNLKAIFEYTSHSSLEEFEKCNPVINEDSESILVVNEDNVSIDNPQLELSEIQICDNKQDTMIKIEEEMPIPIGGMEYKVLLSLKNSMSILEFGQQIMLPNVSTYRYAVKQLEKRFFKDKKFTILSCGEQIMVMLKK